MIESNRNLRCAALRCASFFAILLFIAVPAFAGEDYLQELLDAAEKQSLHTERYWHVLLHYERKGSGVASLIDDRRFFLAPEGKTSPQAELRATLASFFKPEKPGEQHPRSAFAARYEWLKERLGIDSSRLPAVDTSELDAFMEVLDPRGAVLVFPAAHGNGPASMFGHTLLRIDGPGKSGLVSQAVNYAANATDTNGLLYAFRGIFGLYDGRYSILPYYEKVNEYADMERRDIWEYRLTLTPEEVRRMALHVWELRTVSSDYFFFDENCAFQILYLIEAARPGIDLTDRFISGRGVSWVIPVDTVRAVRAAGLVGETAYRPSQVELIRTMTSGLSGGGIETADRVAQGELSPAAVEGEREEKIRTLELAAELLRYRYLRKELAKEVYLPRYLSVLRTRSTLGTLDDPPRVPEPPRPDDGHLPAKISVSAGIRGDRKFLDLRWRPAYHHLLDPTAGYVPGSQIIFLETAVRAVEGEGLRLQEVNLVDIVSLAPRSRFFNPMSWKVRAGMYRRLLADGRDHPVAAINPGAGFAWSTPLGIAYGMLETDIAAGTGYEHGASLAGGLSAGIAGNTSRWNYSLSGETFLRTDTGLKPSWRVAQRNSFPLGDRNMLTVDLSMERAYAREVGEVAVGVSRFF